MLYTHDLSSLQNIPDGGRPHIQKLPGQGKTRAKFKIAVSMATLHSLRGSLRSETELSLSAAAGKPKVKS